MFGKVGHNVLVFIRNLFQENISTSCWRHGWVLDLVLEWVGCLILGGLILVDCFGIGLRRSAGCSLYVESDRL